MTEPILPRAAIPLARLVLCLECEVGFNLAEGATCPACDSMHWAPISAWIGSTLETPR